MEKAIAYILKYKMLENSAVITVEQGEMNNYTETCEKIFDSTIDSDREKYGLWKGVALRLVASFFDKLLKYQTKKLSMRI